MSAFLLDEHSLQGCTRTSILHHHLLGSSRVCHFVSAGAATAGILLVICELRLAFRVDDMLGW